MSKNTYVTLELLYHLPGQSFISTSMAILVFQNLSVAFDETYSQFTSMSYNFLADVFK